MSNVPVADRLLVGRMAEGEDIALGELYDRYGKTLYALALAIVREPADVEEVVVDVLPVAREIAVLGFVDNCGLTEEPAGGSPQPTETPRLLGAWVHTD